MPVLHCLKKLVKPSTASCGHSCSNTSNFKALDSEQGERPSQNQLKIVLHTSVDLRKFFADDDSGSPDTAAFCALLMPLAATAADVAADCGCCSCSSCEGR
eukprot:GHUV01043615.1.p2 GENE.GHUV01043615.1~~GHUV01043615.1.p2  ORF type:complete len:101 (-),score=13.36 GHUV01043615.1:439-741(-)